MLRTWRPFELPDLREASRLLQVWRPAQFREVHRVERPSKMCEMHQEIWIQQSKSGAFGHVTHMLDTKGSDE